MNQSINALLGIILTLVAMELAAENGTIESSVAEASSVKQLARGETVKNRVARYGTQTRLWLDLQASGQVSTQQGQYATSVEQELANQRLLDSYQHPIPEFFEQDTSGDIGE